MSDTKNKAHFRIDIGEKPAESTVVVCLQPVNDRETEGCPGDSIPVYRDGTQVISIRFLM